MRGSNVDVDDPIVQETVTTRDGQVVHPRVRAALGLEPLPAPPEPAAPEATQEAAV